MGVSRRIAKRFKFSRKYNTNVYQFFTKQHYFRNGFITKIMSRLLKTAAYGMEKRLLIVLQKNVRESYHKKVAGIISKTQRILRALKLVYKLKYSVVTTLQKCFRQTQTRHVIGHPPRPCLYQKETLPFRYNNLFHILHKLKRFFFAWRKEEKQKTNYFFSNLVQAFHTHASLYSIDINHNLYRIPPRRHSFQFFRSGFVPNRKKPVVNFFTKPRPTATANLEVVSSSQRLFFPMSVARTKLPRKWFSMFDQTVKFFYKHQVHRPRKPSRIGIVRPSFLSHDIRVWKAGRLVSSDRLPIQVFFCDLLFPKFSPLAQQPCAMSFLTWQKAIQFQETPANQKILFTYVPLFYNANRTRPIAKRYKMATTSTFFKTLPRFWVTRFFGLKTTIRNKLQGLLNNLNKHDLALLAKYNTKFFVKVLNFLMLYPFVKSQHQVFKKKRFWKVLACLGSKTLNKFIGLHVHVPVPRTKTLREATNFADQTYTNQWQVKENVFESYHHQTSVMFKHFMSKLKLKYGYTYDFLSKIPFSLSIPFIKRKHKRPTDKGERFTFLKIIRRHYGNITRKQLWNVRKVSLIKNKGTAFFNSMLILLGSRIDFFTLKCHFFHPVFEARKFIYNGCLVVNGKQKPNLNFYVDFGDIVSIFALIKAKFRIYLTSKYQYHLNHLGGQGTATKIFPSYLNFSFGSIICGFMARRFNHHSMVKTLKIDNFVGENVGKSYFF